MSYAAPISRANPACIVFLVDQSASMADSLGPPDDDGEHSSKSEVVAQVLNEMLYELCIRSAKVDRTEDYFEVAVVGYGHQVASAFTGELEGRDLVPISTLAASPARFESRALRASDWTRVVRVPVWVEPRAAGPTKMGLALRIATSLIDRFLRLHPDCFPPLVVNLTDGEPTDGDPADLVRDLCARTSTDGAALLFNLHLGSGRARPVLFPDDRLLLPDAPSRALFELSSPLPSPMRTLAIAMGLTVSDRSRGFAYNADLSAIVRFLDIGTRAIEQR